MIDLSERAAVVTGGGSGIGRAIVQRLAGQGAAVAIADLNPDGAEETARLVQDQGGKAKAFEVDVADVSSVIALRDAIARELGPVSIVVNNAGWDLGQPFLDTDPEFWNKVVAINYIGPVAVCHAFIPSMIEREDGGSIVNIGSDAGRVGSMGETVYAGAKGGVIAFSKSLAREVARFGINVNCVCPGPTNTPLFFDQPQKVREALVRATPFRRLAEPEDIANAVTFLTSREAGFITGQVLSVSGGLTMAG